MVVYKALNTIRERRTSNARHAVGDGDGCKARATRERAPSNARHAVGDGDGGKAFAIRVFVNLFLSAIYVLNGRKVAAKVL